MFIKITNLVDNRGRANYKGLDMDQIVPGSQLYPQGENVAYFEYDGGEVDLEGVTVITETTYLTVLTTERNKPKPPTEMELLTQRADVTDAAILMLMDLGMKV